MTDKPKPPPTTPLAVALSYDRPQAPRVVAMGRGALGEKIIETARRHGVPLRQDPALAEALASIELDTEIPVELYRAVAEVIGFVLRTAKAGNQGGDGLRSGEVVADDTPPSGQ